MNSVRTGPRGGVPVVFVHPAGLDLTYWDAQIAFLCESYDVIAFDLPGHGRSPGKPADWTLENAALFLAQAIRESGADAAHVVGLSVGSVIAQSLVVTQPSLVRSLTLMGATAVFSEASRNAMLERSRVLKEQGMTAVIQSSISRWFAEETRVRRPDIIDRATKTLLSDDPLVHAALWDMMYGFDVRSRLGDVICPTLLITGQLDESTRPAEAQILHEHIAGSQLSILPKLSHMVPFEDPAIVNRLLKDFLAQQ